MIYLVFTKNKKRIEFSFQNGFGVKEKLLAVFGKSIPRCVPYLSFKRYDGKEIHLEIAKPSPIKGTEEKSLEEFTEIINTYTKKHLSQYLFEGVDSVALQRESDYKAIINSVLNSLCVVYKDNVKNAMHKFEEEFGPEGLSKLCEEINNTFNGKFGNSIFATNTEEVLYKINQVIKKFAKEKPSTYQQYYINAEKRGKVLSEDDYLLGYLIDMGKYYRIDTPISDELRKRMKNIERKINEKVA